MIDRKRELTSHKCSDLNESINIQVQDEPGPGGANHKYRIVGSRPMESMNCVDLIRFQKGAVKDVGLNGISDEVLLAIVEDRLASFQDGPFACLENGTALDCVRSAIKALKLRTQDRISRGVEGHSKK